MGAWAAGRPKKKSWVYEWFSLVCMYGLCIASEASEPPTVDGNRYVSSSCSEGRDPFLIILLLAPHLLDNLTSISSSFTFSSGLAECCPARVFMVPTLVVTIFEVHAMGGQIKGVVAAAYLVYCGR